MTTSIKWILIYLNTLILFTIFLFLPLPHYANDIDLTEENSISKISDQSLYISAGDSILTIHDAISCKSFGFAKPNGKDSYWVKLKQTKISPGAYRLSVGENSLDNFLIWTVDSNENVTALDLVHQKSETEQEKISNKIPTFKIQIDDTCSDIYIYISSKESVLVSPITLFNESDYFDKISTSVMMLGANIGMLMLILCISLIAAFLFKEPLYIYLSTYLSGILVVIISVLGLGSSYIWETTPNISFYLIFLGLLISIISFSCIIINFLKLKSKSQSAYLTLITFNYLSFLAFCFATIFLFLHSTTSGSYFIIGNRFFVTLYPILIIAICIESYLKDKNINSIWLCFLLIWTLAPVLIGSLIPLESLSLYLNNYLLYSVSAGSIIFLYVLIKHHFKSKNDNIELLDTISRLEANLSNSFLEGVQHQRQLISLKLINRVDKSLLSLKHQTNKDQRDIRQFKELDSLCQFVRKTAHKLHSSTVCRYGLIKAIEQEIFNFESLDNEIQINFNYQGNGEHIHSDIAELIYHSFLEILNTISNNSVTSKIDIRLTCDKDLISINVQDYNLKDYSHSESNNFVFQVMKEQISLLGGLFQIGFKKGNFFNLELKPNFSYSYQKPTSLSLAIA